MSYIFQWNRKPRKKVDWKNPVKITREDVNAGYEEYFSRGGTVTKITDDDIYSAPVQFEPGREEVDNFLLGE